MNSGVLFLITLTAWENYDTNISTCMCMPVYCVLHNITADWHVIDEQCWLQLNPIFGFEEEIHVFLLIICILVNYTAFLFQEMDAQDHLQLKAELCLNDTGKYHVTACWYSLKLLFVQSNTLSRPYLCYRNISGTFTSTL